jgi:hypothetical protein
MQAKAQFLMTRSPKRHVKRRELARMDDPPARLDELAVKALDLVFE